MVNGSISKIDIFVSKMNFMKDLIHREHHLILSGLTVKTGANAFDKKEYEISIGCKFCDYTQKEIVDSEEKALSIKQQYENQTRI